MQYPDLDKMMIDEQLLLDFNLRLYKQYEIFLNRKIQQHYHSRWQKQIVKPIRLNSVKEMEEFVVSLSTTKSGKWDDIIFITISPPDNTDTLSFVKKVLHLANLTIFNGYMVAFEQRGATYDEAGKGMHAHLLLTRNHKYNKGKIKSRFLTVLKNQNIYNPQQNNIVNLTKQINKKSSYFSMQFPFNDKLFGKVDYLLGGKNAEKQEKVSIDKIWRNKYDIDPYYLKICEYLKKNNISEYITQKLISNL